jgi:hypothetical protein
MRSPTPISGSYLGSARATRLSSSELGLSLRVKFYRPLSQQESRVAAQASQPQPPCSDLVVVRSCLSRSLPLPAAWQAPCRTAYQGSHQLDKGGRTMQRRDTWKWMTPTAVFRDTPVHCPSRYVVSSPMTPLASWSEACTRRDTPPAPLHIV